MPTSDDRNNIKTWFSHQVEINMASLYKVAFRLTRNSADAEDLVADAVTKAWTSINSLQDRTRFRAWIFRIMHNRFISNYRKKCNTVTQYTYDELDTDNENFEVALVLIQQSNEFLNWWANPEQEFVNNLLGEALISAVESLPEMFQETITLVNLEGFSYDEAAEVLGVSPGTIRSRMNRGRTLLQKALWQHAYETGLISNTALLECQK